MFGSEVLDTAIGLVFVFLLVSMLVTITNELISAVLLSRAKWLRYGMDRLLGSTWAAKIYSHPLVEGSTFAAPTATGDPSGAPSRPTRGSGPSYLTSRAFTDVLLHFVQREDAVLSKVLDAVRAELVKPAVDDLAGPALHVAVIAAATAAVPDGASTSVVSDLARFLKGRRDAFVTSLLSDLRGRVAHVDDALKKPVIDELDNLAAVQKDLGPGDVQARLTAAIGRIGKSGATGEGRQATGEVGTERLVGDLATMVGRLGSGYTVGNAVADIQRFIADIPTNYLQESIDRIEDKRVRRTLHTLLDDAERDVEHFKRNIEVWFNNAMDRVSGWYKRRSQWVIGGLCIVASVGLNVDSMAVVDYLQTNSGVRDALVAKAKAFSDRNATAVAQLPARGPGDGNGAAPAPDPEKTMGAITNQLEVVRTELTGLKLPVGWKWAPDQPGTAEETTKRDPYRLEFRAAELRSTIGFHWLGWFITALAATLGAPFWFDTLNRIIAIRSAGKSPDEQPRAPKVLPKPLAPGQAP